MEISKSRLGEFRWLILGAGAVVAEYYLPSLQLLQSASDAFFIDTSLSALKALTKRFPDISCSQISFREYLENFSGREGFEAAIIALPNYLHAEAAEKLLLKGLHVLCEKPLAMNEASCLQLGRLSEETGKVLAVGMARRLLPNVSALREALKKGLIGSLQSIDIEYGEPYGWVLDSGYFFQRQNGGILADMGVHYLDLVEELIGPLKPISYQDDCRGGVEANSNFHLVSEKGIPVRLSLSRTHLLRNIAVFKGEYGQLILEKDTFEFCLWRRNSDNLIARLYPQKPFQGGNWPATLISCFAEQLLELIEAINSRVSPRVTAYQAAKTIKLLEWAYNNRQEKEVRAESQLRSSDSCKRPKLSPAKVVVTGGTGFIGGHLVSRLVDLGFSDITVPVRNYKTCASIARFSVKMPRISLLDYKQVKSVIQGSRFVFHLAYGRDGYNPASITIKGAQNVVNAAIECRVECVVILSTMYVFGYPSIDQFVDESWPYHPIGGEYGKSKAKMERFCLARARSSGSTRIVVLNPSCVYGPGGTTYTQLPIQMARQGNFCWVEEGRGIANYTFIDNLIDAIILAVSCKEAHGQRFIINDGFCSWREFLAPSLGEFAKSLPSLSKKELAIQEYLSRTSIKNLISHLASDIELIDIINRMPLLGTVKRILLKSIPKLHPTLLDMQYQPTAPLINKDDLLLRRKPRWLGDIFGPTKTKFSAEKAKKFLGWRPLILLSESQEQTRSWLKSINLL